jgi:hypothetical protein
VAPREIAAGMELAENSGMSHDVANSPWEIGGGGNMPHSHRRSFGGNVAFNTQDNDLNVMHLQTVTGGEPRTGQLTGTKALMLAVLEDGIRSFLSNARLLASEAEFWIYSRSRHSPFSFTVVCEILGLDPDAVRKTLKRMKTQNLPPRKAMPRTRHNVRIPGRVYARKSH